MSREDVIRKIGEYEPANEQETEDKALMLSWLEHNDDAFSRENAIAHVTVSGWVVNKDRSKVLMVYHNVYDSWSWLGGHADGETDLLSVAVKEVKEESGLAEVHPVSEDIMSLEVLTVDGHEKKGRYVSSHLHMNVTFCWKLIPSRRCLSRLTRTATWPGSPRRKLWGNPQSRGLWSEFTRSSLRKASEAWI